MTPEERARMICKIMEDRMRAMGVITTVHYDASRNLIAQQIREAKQAAEKCGAAAEREACAKVIEDTYFFYASVLPPGIKAYLAAVIRARVT